MVNTNNNKLSRLSFFASLITLCVIALGAFTRLIDAGLGCPDWPGCYGHLIVSGINLPPVVATSFTAYKAWSEMIHRYFAATLSFFIVLIIFFILRELIQSKVKYTRRLKFNFVLAIVLMLLICYQVILGQLTVTLKLLPIIVSQHLLGGFLILSTLWLVFLNNRPAIIINYLSQRSLWLGFTAIGLILLAMQISLGAWTSTNYAALSCSDFPFCQNHQTMLWHFNAAFNFHSSIGLNYQGGLLNDAARQTIQMTHRLMALMVSSYLILFAAYALKKLDFALTKYFFILLPLLLLQICLGISNVVLGLPVAIAVCHTLTAAMLLLTLVTIFFQFYLSELPPNAK